MTTKNGVVRSLMTVAFSVRSFRISCGNGLRSHCESQRDGKCEQSANDAMRSSFFEYLLVDIKCRKRLHTHLVSYANFIKFCEVSFPSALKMRLAGNPKKKQSFAYPLKSVLRMISNPMSNTCCQGSSLPSLVDSLRRVLLHCV